MGYYLCKFSINQTYSKIKSVLKILYRNVYNSSIHSFPKLNTVQAFIIRRTGKQSVLYLHKGIQQ